jgi:cell division protein FtsN
MPKDYAKFVPPKSRLNLPHRWPVKLAVVVAVVLVLAGLGGYYYIATSMPEQGDFMGKLNALIHHKKIPGKEVAKLASAQPAQPRTVRFDFYEQLPNMQMPADNPMITSSPAPVATSVLTTTPELTAQPPVPMPIPAARVAPVARPVAQSAPPHTPAAPAPAAFNPEELTHLLETEHPKPAPVTPVITAPATQAANHYIIKMGDFDTESGAKGLVSAINSVGFDAKVVKISRGGRTIYQVQQGPYESMALASQSQQRMQKRGLISTIIKSI